MNQTIQVVEDRQLRSDIPGFQAGDTVRVHVKIKEGDKERIQAFEGVVIARKHSGVRETITVRKTSFGVGVERIFPLHASVIDRIELVRQGRVRRAKLYYLRKLRGKAARIRERDTRGERAMKAAAAAARASSTVVETAEPTATSRPSQARASSSSGVGNEPSAVVIQSAQVIDAGETRK